MLNKGDRRYHLQNFKKCTGMHQYIFISVMSSRYFPYLDLDAIYLATISYVGINSGYGLRKVE